MKSEQKKKLHFKEEFRDFCHNYKQISPDALDNVTRSKVLTEFYVRDVLRVVSPTLAPDDDEDLARCIVDGSNDLGVDFIWRNEGNVIIIQTKYQGEKGKKNFDEDFCYFCDVVRRLYTSRDKIKNRALEEILDDIDWQNDNFELHFICLAAATPAALERESCGQDPIPQLVDIENRTRISLLDSTRLNESLRDARDYDYYVNQVVPVKLTAEDGANPWLSYQNSDGCKCFIGLISGGQINNLVKQFRTKLFSLNIRNYLGDLSTNKQIIQSAIEEPDNFFFYNNGLSAVATHIEPRDGGVLECKRFCIINGAQTANSIERAYKKDKTRSARDVQVIIRITEIDISDVGFLDNITKYNNTQNAIKIPDFRSNDPVQRDLNRQFGKLVYKGKHYLYLNKRSKENTNNKLPIRMEEFTKSVHSFLYGPADYFGGTSYLFDTKPGQGYAKTFGDGDRVASSISSEEFKRLAGIYFLCAQANGVRSEYRNNKINALPEGEPEKSERALVIKNSLERKWLVYFVLGELLRHKANNDGADLNNFLRRLAKPDWQQPESTTYVFIRVYCNFACDLLVRTFRHAQQNSEFTYRNWFRNRRYLDMIRAEIADSGSMLDMLPKI